jgi:hypothetical protein
MRNIDSSDWFTGPRLDLIKSTQSDRSRIANFTLRGAQKIQKPETQDGTAGEAEQPL